MTREPSCLILDPALLLLALLLSGVGDAAVLRVSTSGSDALCQAGNGPCASISVALGMSSSGDRVVVDAGVYVQRSCGSGIVLQNMNISLEGAAAVSGAVAVVWDCAGSGRFLFLNASRARIRGIEFGSGSTTSAGGAIYALNTYMDVADCVFRGNRVVGTEDSIAVFFGGALAIVFDASVGSVVETTRVVRSHFIGNAACRGGGATLLFLGVPQVTSEVEWDNSTFVGNTAEKNGGGVCMAYVRVVIMSGSVGWSGSSFVSNSARSSGGGVCLYSPMLRA